MEEGARGGGRDRERQKAKKRKREKEGKKKIRVHVCRKRMSEIVLLSGFSSVWRRDVARLERPRESSSESRRTGL